MNHTPATANEIDAAADAIRDFLKSQKKSYLIHDFDLLATAMKLASAGEDEDDGPDELIFDHLDDVGIECRYSLFSHQTGDACQRLIMNEPGRIDWQAAPANTAKRFTRLARAELDLLATREFVGNFIPHYLAKEEEILFQFDADDGSPTFIISCTEMFVYHEKNEQWMTKSEFAGENN